MEVVEENKMKYEAISTFADPLYLKFKNSIDIVKDFIRQRKLIIYGGTAIDYALRLRGDNIYPDESLAVPDLDMYSPDIVHDAYTLADILFEAGYTEVRVVVGRYVRVLKVDIGDKHFVADIAFMAKPVYDLVPTVEYEGMRVVHPTFQRVDLHSSLAYPFDGAPLEVIFNRWNKDITRFNKLHAAYPLDTPSSMPPEGSLKLIKIDNGLTCEVFAGFAAYAICRRALIELIGEEAVNESGIIKAICRDTPEYLELEVPFGKIEFLHHTPHSFIKKYPAKYQKYASVASMLPKHWVGDVGNVTVALYSGAHRYTCIGFIERTTPPRLKFTGVQWLLSYFIGGYLFTPLFVKSNDVDMNVAKNIFLGYYLSMLKMVEMAESALVSKVAHMTDEDINKCAFLPNTYVYGNDNQSEGQIIQNKMTIAQRMGEAFSKPLPLNYYPARRNPHPKFDYNTSEYFIKDGRPLPRSSGIHGRGLNCHINMEKMIKKSCPMSKK